MTNISITKLCNRKCPYCFAQDAGREADDLHMSLDDFETSMDFWARSGSEELKFMGGEPTLHPSFCQMLDRALERGFRVLVFTGGFVPEHALRHLEKKDRKTSLMLNLIPMGVPDNGKRTRQTAVMERLGPKLAVGLNIQNPSILLNFMIDTINKYGLQRTIRLSLAHPMAGARNKFLRARDYPKVGRRVADFYRHALEESIHVEFDCGWVPCMFPESFFERSHIAPGEIGLRCNPIIDILPGLKAISCYPLARIASEPLPADQDDSWLAARFEAKLASFRPLKIYKHCDECKRFTLGECAGGCIAASMVRINKSRPSPLLNKDD